MKHYDRKRGREIMKDVEKRFKEGLYRPKRNYEQQKERQRYKSKTDFYEIDEKGNFSICSESGDMIK